MLSSHISVLIAIVLLSFAGNVESFGTNSLSRATSSNLNMKIFDWKKREEFQKYQMPDDYNLNVNTIFAIPGSRQKFRRVGRGISAGQGKSCGTGQHGQNSRSGAGTRPGFEGGQTPLYRRLPKYVGKTMRAHTKTVYSLIKLEKLNKAEPGSTVEFNTLFEKGVLTKTNKGIDIFKVVGGGDLTVKGLTVKAHAFTESAKAAIEGNGGSCIILSPTRHIPIEEAMADAKAIKDANLIKLKEFRLLKAKRDEAKAMA